MENMSKEDQELYNKLREKYAGAAGHPELPLVSKLIFNDFLYLRDEDGLRVKGWPDLGTQPAGTRALSSASARLLFPHVAGP